MITFFGQENEWFREDYPDASMVEELSNGTMSVIEEIDEKWLMVEFQDIRSFYNKQEVGRLIAELQAFHDRMEDVSADDEKNLMENGLGDEAELGFTEEEVEE